MCAAEGAEDATIYFLPRYGFSTKEENERSDQGIYLRDRMSSAMKGRIREETEGKTKMQGDQELLGKLLSIISTQKIHDRLYCDARVRIEESSISRLILPSRGAIMFFLNSAKSRDLFTIMTLLRIDG